MTMRAEQNKYPIYLATMLQGLIDRLPEAQEQNLKRIAQGQMELVLEQMNKLLDLINNPDPMKSPLAIDVAEEGQRATLNQVFTQSKNRINAEIDKYKSSQVNERLLTSNLKVNDFASEIRAAFRTMSLSEKHQTLNDAIQSGDGAVVAALVLDVPSVLIGLDAATQEKYKESFLDKWSEASSEYVRAIETIAKTFFESVSEYTLPLKPKSEAVAA